MSKRQRVETEHGIADDNEIRMEDEDASAFVPTEEVPVDEETPSLMQEEDSKENIVEVRHPCVLFIYPKTYHTLGPPFFSQQLRSA